MEAYEDHVRDYHPSAVTPFSQLHSPYETTLLAVDIFQKLEEEGGGAEGGTVGVASGGTLKAGSADQKSRFFINTAVELTTSWIRDIFDE